MSDLAIIALAAWKVSWWLGPAVLVASLVGWRESKKDTPRAPMSKFVANGVFVAECQNCFSIHGSRTKQNTSKWARKHAQKCVMRWEGKNEYDERG